MNLGIGKHGFPARTFNKGVKLIRWDGKQKKIKIYDYKKRQGEIDATLKGFRLG